MMTLLEKLKAQGSLQPSKTSNSLMELYALGLWVIVDGCNAASVVEITTTLTTEIMRLMAELKLATKLVELCFETMTKLLKTGGALLIQQHRAILDLCLRDLHSNYSTLQLRARMCIGSVCPYLTDVNLAYLTDTLLLQIQPGGPSSSEGKQSTTTNTSSTVNLSIEAFSIVASRCGHRLGQSLPVIIPLFLTFIGDVKNLSDEMTSEKMCILRENMCIALTKFAERCPMEGKRRIPKVTQPNFVCRVGCSSLKDNLCFDVS